MIWRQAWCEHPPAQRLWGPSPTCTCPCPSHWQVTWHGMGELTTFFQRALHRGWLMILWLTCGACLTIQTRWSPSWRGTAVPSTGQLAYEVDVRGGEIPVACWQQALCTIVPMSLACGRLSFGHGHGLPVPWWPFSWSGLSWVRGHVIPYDRQGQIGEWQKTQILKFNSPTPYTFSLQCPSNRKFSQLSYEPGCSRELWCRKCATWLWNKYVLIFSKTLFYTHIQRHTAAAGTKSYKTM